MINRIYFLIILFSIPVNCQDKILLDSTRIRDAFLYLAVDKPPVFEHSEKLMEFVYNNLKWPEDLDAEGQIIVSFIVTKEGKVCTVKIEKGLCPLCDNEVKRVFESMPDWIPGVHEDKPVDVLIYMPVFFKLE